MRFLVDAQLPPSLADSLQQRGYEAEHAGPQLKDGAIWARAVEQGWIIVTKDRDFAVWAICRGEGPQVVWIRLGNATTNVLTRGLDARWPKIERRLARDARLVEVGRPRA